MTPGEINEVRPSVSLLNLTLILKLKSLLETSEPSFARKLYYPDFIPIMKDERNGEIAQKSVILTKESVQLSSVSSILVDSFREMKLYRVTTEGSSKLSDNKSPRSISNTIALRLLLSQSSPKLRYIYASGRQFNDDVHAELIEDTFFINDTTVFNMQEFLDRIISKAYDRFIK